MSLAPDITAPLAALDDAARIRAQFRGVHPGDPARRDAIQGAMDALRAAWGAEHETYVRRGRKLGRAYSDDPVRVAGRERQAELKRLRAALNPTSGRARAEAKTWTAAQLAGRLRQSSGHMDALAAEYRTVRRVLGRGGPAARRGGGVYISMHELNAEAARLLEDLREERRDLRTAWQRFERTPVRTYAQRDEFDRLADRLADLREFADLLGRELSAAARQRTPDARAPRATWTAAAIREALSDFRHEHGRLPTKRELNTVAGLPHYTTCVRKLGPSPLSNFA